MLYWPECDVAIAVTAALRAGQASRQALSLRYKLFADSIVEFGIADAWQRHRGQVNPNGCDTEATWLETLLSNRHSDAVCLESPGIRYNEALSSLVKKAFEGEISDESPPNALKPLSVVFAHLGERHYLVCLSANSTGCIDCIEFLRFGNSQLMFSQRNMSFVNMLFAVFIDAPSGQPLVSESELSLEVQQLPKRQREVLKQLILGACVKEIASNLGISRHTVNDYTKSLYRRFNVSGRSELVALFYTEAREASDYEFGRPIATRRAARTVLT